MGRWYRLCTKSERVDKCSLGLVEKWNKLKSATPLGDFLTFWFVLLFVWDFAYLYCRAVLSSHFIHYLILICLPFEVCDVFKMWVFLVQCLWIMFKKASEAKSFSRLSGADRKKLKRTIKERFAQASDADVDIILPPKVIRRNSINLILVVEL